MTKFNFKDLIFNFRNYFSELSKAIRVFVNSSSKVSLIPIKNKGVEIIILFLFGTGAYINTIGHQLTFDDEQIIKKNDFVLRGIKEVPSIFKYDTYHSYYENTGIEKIWPGGRYRPLSAVSFSLEQELIGTWKYGVPRQFIWDTNGNGSADPDEDSIKDYVLNEDDFFNRGTGLRHFNNVLLYAISIITIYFFLSLFFKNLSSDIVFFGSILFAIHPIHTEVVANIKSRDEILSLFLIVLSLIFSLRFFNKKNNIDLIFFIISFFAAILSKEYAVFVPFILFFILIWNRSLEIKSNILELLLPLLFLCCSILISIFFCQKIWVGFSLILLNLVFILFYSKSTFNKLMHAVSIVVVAYLTLRLNAVSTQGNLEIFNGNIITNPYLLATREQILVSKITVLLRYLFLLFVPLKLSCDYSFNSLPYSDFSSPLFYVTIFFYLSLFIIFISALRRKSHLSFFIFWYLIFLIPVSNLFFNIGATMGERLVYHSSFGFCFAVLFPLEWIKSLNFNESFKKNSLIVFFGLVFVSFLFLTLQRNRDWKNNFSLYSSDVKKYPNNLVLLSGTADEFYKKATLEESPLKRKEWVQKSIQYVDKGLQINAAYFPLFNTLALDFYLIDSIGQSAKVCRKGLELFPENPLLIQVQKVISKDYVKLGIVEFKKKKLSEAMNYFNKAIELDQKNTDAMYNKAYVFRVNQDTISAINTLELLIKIEPKKEAIKMLKDLQR